MGLIKPYIRSLKVVVGFILFVMGTLYAIRRENPLKNNIQEFLKENIPVYKNYEYISAIEQGHINLQSQAQFGITINAKELEKLSSSNARLIVHKFRLSDTLYTLNLCVNYKDSVIAMSKPIKIVQ